MEGINQDGSAVSLLKSNKDLKYEIAEYNAEQRLRAQLDPILDKLIIKKGRAGIWEVIDEILKFLWKFKRPYMVALVAEIKQEREDQKNQLGSSFTGVRKLGSMPEELELILRRAYIEEIDYKSKGFRREFFKRYPMFRVAEKI